MLWWSFLFYLFLLFLNFFLNFIMLISFLLFDCIIHFCSCCGQLPLSFHPFFGPNISLKNQVHINWFHGIYLKGTHQDPKLTSKGTEEGGVSELKRVRRENKLYKLNLFLITEFIIFFVEKNLIFIQTDVFSFSLHTFIAGCVQIIYTL